MDASAAVARIRARHRVAWHALAVVVAVVALAWSGTAHAKKRAPCLGRFLVAGDGTGASRSTPDVLEVAHGYVTLGDCVIGRVRLRAGKRFTLVRGHAKTCAALRGVTVVVKIAAPGCDTVEGVMRARKEAARSFTAIRSACGDGVWDPGSETCDAGRGCPAGEACGTDCACHAPADEPPGATTTTTTTPVGSTTTTTVADPGCHVRDVPFEGTGKHFPEGTPLTYVNNPPASGDHYPVWARYEDFSVVIPRPYWLHNLEHGAVVMLYRPDAPPDVIVALHQEYTQVPLDPDCGNTTTLTLMTPDPLLPTTKPFAVVARNKEMECGVPSLSALIDFVNQFRGKTGGEHECSEGAYPY
jgi:hypothetical protein